MKSEDVAVEMRLTNLENGKVKAFADVTIPLGSDGLIRLSGFSVIESDGKLPRVAPPARKGKMRYFEVVGLIGKIHSIVDEALLTEYERQKKSQANQRSS